MIRRALVVAAIASVWMTSSASAQQAGLPPPAPNKIAEQAQFSVKHHFSFFLSGGWDLDVIGNLLKQTEGSFNGQQVIIEPPQTAYTDIYVATPKRGEAAVGFGISKRSEIVFRVSQARYQSSPAAIGAPNDALTVSMTPYREQSLELGLRHYFATGRTFRRYANFMFGQRKIDALSGTFTGDPTFLTDPNIGVLRLYGASTVPSISLEFGQTYETKHIGIFLEGGMRWQQRLNRIDDDLTPLGLQLANNTGGRLYIPLQFGVLFRL